MAAPTERSNGTPLSPESFVRPQLSPEDHHRLSSLSDSLRGLSLGRESHALFEDPTCEQYDDLTVTSPFMELPSSVRGLIVTVGGGIFGDAEVTITHGYKVRQLSPELSYRTEHHDFRMEFPTGHDNHVAIIHLEPELPTPKTSSRIYPPPKLPEQPPTIIKRLDLKRRNGLHVVHGLPSEEQEDERIRVRARDGYRKILEQSPDGKLRLFEDLVSVLEQRREASAA